MLVTIHPSFLNGTVSAPASKSSMQRGCAAALLHEGVTILRNPGVSNDDKAAIEVIQKLGAAIEWVDGNLQVTSKGIHPVSNEMNCGESGLGIRMFTPLAALSSHDIVITGEGSLQNRPMDFFDEIFPQLNIAIHTNKGKLPVAIKGPLQPHDIIIDGSLSSQFLTGLLFAFGKAATKPVTITVNNLKSKPYIDLTLQVMKDFGYNVINENYERFLVSPATTNDQPATINFMVEGDWSGGAFLLVAGAIAGNIIVKGLDIHSTQADKAILQALRSAGAKMEFVESNISVSRYELQGFEFDATDCPDLFPPLVALAAYCKTDSIIKGVGRLAHKESNRALTLQQEFAKLNVTIKLEGDNMIVKAGSIVKGAAVHSRHDHRIAMACAVAALKADGETVIQEAEAINKSYPVFYEHLKLLGAGVSLLTNV